MKKLFFAIIFVTCFLSTVVFAQTAEMGSGPGPESFLLQNYGWTIDFSKQEKRFFGFSWDLTCSPKQVLPKEGINVFRVVVCVQQDKTFHTVILWRVSSVKPAAIERMVYNGMSDGLGYGKVICHGEVVSSAVARKESIKDCEVPLQNGTFYTSFYHFDVVMPVDGSFVNNKGKKEETLGFTIWVQNAGNIDPSVREKIRQLVSWIRTAEK